MSNPRAQTQPYIPTAAARPGYAPHTNTDNGQRPRVPEQVEQEQEKIRARLGVVPDERVAPSNQYQPEAPYPSYGPFESIPTTPVPLGHGSQVDYIELANDASSPIDSRTEKLDPMAYLRERDKVARDTDYFKLVAAEDKVAQDNAFPTTDEDRRLDGDGDRNRGANAVPILPIPEFTVTPASVQPYAYHEDAPKDMDINRKNPEQQLEDERREYQARRDQEAEQWAETHKPVMPSTTTLGKEVEMTNQPPPDDDPDKEDDDKDTQTPPVKKAPPSAHKPKK